MKHYILNSNKSLKMILEGTEENIKLNLNNLEDVLYTTHPPNNLDDYFEDGKWVSIGSAPSSYHVFNYDIKKWIDNRSEEQVQKDLLNQLKIDKLSKEESGFFYKNYKFDSDKSSQIKILLATATAEKDLEWIDANNNVIFIPKNDILNFKKALVDHLQEVSDWYNNAKSSILNP